MNIFILDYDAQRAARMQCDKHIVKMPLESAQILCSLFPDGLAPYKRTHYNHPCSIWARTSKANFQWLVRHGLALCDEYTFRYGKTHKSKLVIIWCSKNISKIKFNHVGRTRFVMCFDQKFKIGNAVESYREYYRCEKNKIAKWRKNRPRPSWFSSTAF